MRPRPRSLAATIGALGVAILVAAGLAAPVAAQADTRQTHVTPATTARGSRPAAALDRSRLPRAVSHSTAGGEVGGASSTRLPTRGPVQVMLELDAAPSAAAYASALGRGRRAAAGAGRAQRTRVLAAQRAVLAALTSPATSGRRLYTTTAVYAGVAVSTDATHLPALGALPGVKAVHLLTPKRLANASTVPLIGGPKAWSSAGTGTGMRIGIIDSGIDYTHADFGGPGTAADYTAARAASTQPPAYPAGGNVVGGVDLAGDAYDPAATLADGSPDTSRTTPRPDTNPLDCEGHGTHVAGTAAGLGVSADGTTYRGPWSDGLSTSGLRIGPGVAPGATLVAIKVFGCEGSTDLVAQGLDWAGDPNRDGDVSDHLDVVNLSLGGDFASPQDPDSVAADNLAALGTVVVAAAGNAGDLQDSVGSPGSATRAIAVAASNDAVSVVDGLDVPPGVEAHPSLDGATDGVLGAEQSSGDAASGVAPYDWVGKGGVRRVPLVVVGTWPAPAGPGNNSDGCDRYSAADAAAVAGKVAFVQWTDTGTRRCGSGERGANAVAAGAVGVVLGDDVNSFTAGIAGDPRLPMMLLISQGTDALKGAVDASGNDGSVVVSLTNDHRSAVRVDLHGSGVDPTDRVGAFSSRGFGTGRTVKPDVTAPGVTVFSADVGSGAGGVSDSGTSMASPHVAGLAALVRAAHRSWTVEQVKAAIIGTAGAGVAPESGASRREGPARAGAGRVQAQQAVNASTLAYGTDGSGGVSLSFGDVAVTTTATASRGLRVVNTSDVDRLYTLSYRSAVTTPGVRLTVSPSALTVPAHSTGRAVVDLTLTAAAMRRTLDPAMSAQDGLRSYYADAGGAVVVSAPGSRVTVPVYVAPRPASTMTSASTVAVGASGDGPLALTGHDLLQGSGPDAGNDPTVYASTVTALMLSGTSPQLPSCTPAVAGRCTPFADERAGDLRYVGVGSDAPYVRDAFNGASGADNGYAYFGISTWGPWRTPASYAEFDVYVDTDAGSSGANPGPELMLFNSRLAPDSDTMLTTLVDLRTGDVVDQEPLNGALGSLDTGLFHSDSMVLPLWLPALRPYLKPAAAGTARIDYWVQATTVESGVTDGIGSRVRPLSVDLRSPALRAVGDAGVPALNDDAPGAGYRLTVHRDLANVGRDKPLGLLLIHHQNANGVRAQVVRAGGQTATTVATSLSSYRYGARPTFTATVRPGFGATPPTGTVTFRDGAKVIGRSALVRGRAVVRPSAVLRGAHVVTATYDGSALWLPSRSTGVRLSVAGVPTSTTISVRQLGPRPGGLLAAAAVAPGSILTPVTGYVTFREGARALGRTVPVRGRASLRLPALVPGRHVLRATYDGSGVYAPSTSRPVLATVR